MSLNHIVRDTVPEDEAISVKFDVCEVNELIINHGTGGSSYMDLKSLPTKSSAVAGNFFLLSAIQFVNAFLHFDDPAKLSYYFQFPSASSLDSLIGLTGTDTFSFKFDVVISNALNSTNQLTLHTGLTNNITLDKYPGGVVAFTHTGGITDCYTFLVRRQTDGSYIVYGG